MCNIPSNAFFTLAHIAKIEDFAITVHMISQMHTHQPMSTMDLSTISMYEKFYEI